MTTLPLSSQPTHRNEAFICGKCGQNVPLASSGCRNHCTKCLYSKHVDQNAPGDRMADCGGLMEPISITQKSGKEKQIVHLCLKCGKKEANIIAPDDNIETIIQVMQRQNIEIISDHKPDEIKKRFKKRF